MEKIKASDIMIGNYIRDVHSENGFFKVTQLKKYSAVYGNDYSALYGALRPIPLTEYVLLKCGASIITIDNKNSYTPNGYVGRVFKIGEFKCYVDREYNKWGYRATMIEDINYLHQLQNLFKCLTKTELKIEL